LLFKFGPAIQAQRYHANRYTYPDQELGDTAKTKKLAFKECQLSTKRTAQSVPIILKKGFQK